MYDVLIVGAGPAGLQAATAAASEGFSVCLLEADKAGGQIGQTPRLENSVFARGITSGPAVAKMMREQAERFGVVVRKGQARALVPAVQEWAGQPAHVIHSEKPNGDREDITARAVVIATGLRWRKLTHLHNATTQGIATYGPAHALDEWRHTDRVLVYGGGPSAGQAVIELADKGVNVVWVVRGQVNMPEYLQAGIRKRHNHVEFLKAEIRDIWYEGAAASVELEDDTAVNDINHVLLCMGQLPNTEWLKDSGVWLDGGKIKVNDRLMTNLGGVFAVGDVRSGSTARVGAAVGDGSFVVSHLWDFLEQPGLAAA